MVTTAQRLEGLEKMVEDLSGAVQGLQAFQTSAEERQASVDAKHASMEAKIDAVLKKLSVEIPSNKESESSKTPQTEEQVPPLQALQKMDLPSFDGSDAVAWLARAEQYFLVHETPVEQRLKIALIAMTGPAMSWIQLLLRRHPKLAWPQFSRELLLRFGDGTSINGFEALIVTKQMASLEEYITAFESRVSQLPDLTDDQLLGFFLGGLRKQIRMQIQDPNVTDYSAAIQMARKIDHISNPQTYQSRNRGRPGRGRAGDRIMLGRDRM